MLQRPTTPMIRDNMFHESISIDELIQRRRLAMMVILECEAGSNRLLLQIISMEYVLEEANRNTILCRLDTDQTARAFKRLYISIIDDSNLPSFTTDLRKIAQHKVIPCKDPEIIKRMCSLIDVLDEHIYDYTIR